MGYINYLASYIGYAVFFAYTCPLAHNFYFRIKCVYIAIDFFLYWVTVFLTLSSFYISTFPLYLGLNSL